MITAGPELDDVRVLVLTTFDIEEYVFEALRSGASGFLLSPNTAARRPPRSPRTW